MTDETTDLWLEARQHTARLAYKMREPQNSPFGATIALGRTDAAIMPDFNKYRQRSLLPYIDAGADAFMFRMGGPLQWVSGNWRYTMDPTWRPLMEEADRLGFLDRVIGYIVHNPFELYTVNGATGETMHTELIDEWTSGGYMPRAFVYDHEVARCWQNGVLIQCSPYNLVKSLEVNTQNTWEKYHRTVGIYTARWFTDANARVEHETYFYNINRPPVDGGVGLQRPLIFAWYGQDMAVTYTSLETAVADLFQPTDTQTKAYLALGSAGHAWQFTDRLKLEPDTIGVDASVSLGNKAQFLHDFGLFAAEPPVPPPPEPEPEPFGLPFVIGEDMFPAIRATADLQGLFLDRHKPGDEIRITAMRKADGYVWAEHLWNGDRVWTAIDMATGWFMEPV